MPEAERAAKAVKSALSVGEDDTTPNVLMVSAHSGQGVEDLVAALPNVITSTDRERLRVRERLISAWDSTLLNSTKLETTLQALEKGSITLQEAVDKIREEG